MIRSKEAPGLPSQRSVAAGVCSLVISIIKSWLCQCSVGDNKYIGPVSRCLMELHMDLPGWMLVETAGSSIWITHLCTVTFIQALN